MNFQPTIRVVTKRYLLKKCGRVFCNCCTDVQNDCKVHGCLDVVTHQQLQKVQSTPLNF